MIRERWIGDRAFYRKLLWLAVPIIVQNGITNLVGFLDNIMVGQLGTEPMSGVAIVNQLVFVFNLLVFGGFSGAGIFGAQFYGHGDMKGVRDTFRFKLIMGIIIIAAALTIFLTAGGSLIRLYLTSGESGNLEAAYTYGRQYLSVIVLEILPFTLVQVYVSTLRETGQTMVPMVSGLVAVFVNMTFNYILIFGKFGAPALGVRGAAAATVLARVVECAIVVAWTHLHREKNAFIIGAYKSLRLPGTLAADIIKKGAPLLVNEFLWSAGVAMANQCFSVRGFSVVASVNIASTIGNLFNVIFIAMGDAVAILVGQLLGASQFEQAKDTARKVIVFSVFCTMITSLIMLLVAPFFPQAYNTSGEVRHLASRMIQITACLMPLEAFLHAAYFTIRSGGRTIITFFFDSAYSWCVVIPVLYSVVHFTALPILPTYLVYFLVMDGVKSIVGYILLKKGIWIRNIVV